MRRHLLVALAIVAVAFAVRWALLSGLVLGDDPEEFTMLQQVLAGGLDFHDQLQVRFGGWILNYVAARLFGMSETTLLLPTWLLSSSFGAIAYALLLHWGYGIGRSTLGALVVVTAPFEVVLGTLRANDLYLAGALNLGFLALVLCEDRPLRQGLLVAIALWFAFYVKLWAVYALPALALYVLVERRWRFAASFAATSLVLHGATLLFWKTRLGVFAPFVSTHAATYPVGAKELAYHWLRYPHMLFVGSEFGTTLFGVVPYVLAILLAVRLARRRLDRPDRLLVGFWGTLLLLLEFFPTAFTLDAYYTVPRIFRYLAPISFPLALHAAKLVLDATSTMRATAIAAVLLVLVNLVQAADATSPGRVYHGVLMTVVREIERRAPPQVVAETNLAYWLRALYLDPDTVETEVVEPPDLYAAAACERWIRDTGPSWPTGTLLVTGLGNYVHYGAHGEGFRLAWFGTPLDARWQLVGEYGVLSYLPRPEAARFWRLTQGAAPRIVKDDPPPPGELSSAERFTAGMARFDAGDHRGARAQFRVLMDARAPEAEDATFFHAASFFRDSDWVRARHEFKRLLHRFPKGRWVAAAHWHIGICDLRRGQVRRARRRFEYVVRRYPEDVTTVANSRIELSRMELHDGVLVRLWRRVRGGGA